MDDPFEQVLNDTREQASRLAQYLDSGHELDEEVRDILEDLEETVRELDSSIMVMRREGFVDSATILVRENRMQDLKRELARLKTQMKSSSRSTQEDGGPETSADSSSPRNNLLQEQMMEEQDQHLDTIHQTMQNLHLQASTMGQELEDQGMLLEEMDGGVDNVMSKLSRGRRQLEWVYEKNKEKYNDCCIGLLIVALIVLLVLAFVL
ncbi:LAQU0S11e03818g1_1 [Lachancea quebecensis]|uniref:t-SNARE affecting a late Golgi compartment protein 1 n=1 Tax=Lachancea quebecensis TaxID=1654605 RepID=A0A0N7MM07_9SACH|nr:LAQU0S11e03818g1_1 [Lachancea quebecensis]